MIKKTKNKKTSSKIEITKSINTNDEAVISVLEKLPICVVIFTLDQILFLNKPALKILKPSKTKEKSITGHSIFEYLLPEYRKTIKENTLNLFKGNESEPFELKIKNGKNEIIDLEVKSNVIEFKGQKAVQTIFTEISEQVKYREELSDAKQNLELITENANDLIYFYTYHPKPKYIYISPTIKKILGYSAQEFYNNANLATTIVTDKKAYNVFEAGISKKQKNNTFKHTSAAFQYKTKSGKLIWLEDNYSPIYDENGKIKFILGISRDITKEKETQIELEQKWNNYKNLLDTSPIGIFIHKGYCLYSNKTAANILEEKNPQKLLGADLIKFIIPEQRQTALDRMARAVVGEELTDLTYKIRTTKGHIIDVELKTVPFIYNGEPCVQTIISDISAEKQLSKEKLRAEIAEEANKKLTEEINYRQKIQQELVTQTTKYEAIFNNSSHLIWTINKDLRITSFNPKYYEYIKTVFNHQLKAGQHLAEIMKNLKDDAKVTLWANKYNNFFNKKKDNKVESFEIKDISPGGKVYYREIFLHPIRSSDGKINEIAIIGHDTTERRLSEQKIIEQSAKLKAIFESGKQLIWTVDKNYFFTSFNQNFSDAMYDVYKVRPTLEKKIYKPQKTKEGKEYHNWWIKKYNEVFKSGNGIEFTTEQQNARKNKVYRQIFLHPILKNGIVEEISCISNDVTELKHLEKQSVNQAAKLSSIFESSSHLIWTIDKDYKATSFNKNFSKAFKLYNKAEPQLNVQLHTLLPKRKQADYKAYWYTLYKKVFHGNSLKLERQQLEPNGDLNYKEIYLNPVRNNNNEIIEVACLAHDITENKRFEQQIIDQSAKLKAIFESGDHLIWTIGPDMKLSSFNKNYANSVYDFYGYYPEIGKSMRSNKTVEYHSIWDEKYELAFQGKQVEFISERTQSNGKKIIRQILLYPIKDGNNKVIEISGIGFDITENKINEEKITQSLKEKDILLKEVHHRVKNNMQVISSILNLQSSYVKDTYALNLLKECQNRIKSMAFIHESLYQTKNFESVNFSEYITTLSKNLVHTYSINTKKIKLILTLDKLFLSLDASIPCGLIINEIISNSLKYAFPDNRDGIIFVTLRVNKNKVKIEVGDNGVGIPESVDVKNTQTLGLQLVDTLIEQLNGTLKLIRKNGTIFSIEFNI